METQKHLHRYDLPVLGFTENPDSFDRWHRGVLVLERPDFGKYSLMIGPGIYLGEVVYLKDLVDFLDVYFG